MELIDKDALVAEIERLENKAIRWAKCKGGSEYEIGKRDAYNVVLAFLDTLEVKEIDFPSDLDEAAIQAHIRLEEGEGLSFLNIFKAGAQWRDAQIPKLPDSIDEAAQKVEDYYDVGEGHGCLCCHRGDIKGAFKAGAEWMAGKYKTLGETEIYLEDDGGEAPYTQEWLDLATTEFAVPEGFKPGDKVIVQIRKK